MVGWIALGLPPCKRCLKSTAMANFSLSTGSDAPSVLADYDPNGVGSKSANLFGLPSNDENSRIIILPVPWEVTVSYGAGTAKGPAAILDASTQLDLYDPEGVKIWEVGVFMPPISDVWQQRNNRLRQQAADYIAALEESENPLEEAKRWTTVIDNINQASVELNAWLKAEALKYLSAGQFVGVIGGDHSSPLGLMQALAQHHPEYSILHIDAHADLRVAYEGFTFSHASIMDNALKIPQISRIVQVGIRDLCPAEAERIEQSNHRIIAFHDWELKSRQFTGQPWHQTCEEILAALSSKVYISFDIDGLDPSFCPHTGTPVPGGLRFEEAAYLLTQVARSDKQIIGFDLCEVAPGEDDWDGNVGARILYKLVSALAQSQHWIG